MKQLLINNFWENERDFNEWCEEYNIFIKGIEILAPINIILFLISLF